MWCLCPSSQALKANLLPDLSHNDLKHQSSVQLGQMRVNVRDQQAWMAQDDSDPPRLQPLLRADTRCHSGSQIRALPAPPFESVSGPFRELEHLRVAALSRRIRGTHTPQASGMGDVSF